MEVFLGVKNFARNTAFGEALAFFEEEYNMLCNDVVLKEVKDSKNPTTTERPAH